MKKARSFLLHLGLFTFGSVFKLNFASLVYKSRHSARFIDLRCKVEFEHLAKSKKSLDVFEKTPCFFPRLWKSIVRLASNRVNTTTWSGKILRKARPYHIKAQYEWPFGREVQKTLISCVSINNFQANILMSRGTDWKMMAQSFLHYPLFPKKNFVSVKYKNAFELLVFSGPCSSIPSFAFGASIGNEWGQAREALLWVHQETGPWAGQP